MEESMVLALAHADSLLSNLILTRSLILALHLTVSLSLRLKTLPQADTTSRSTTVSVPGGI
eukprot:818312-Amorphochlora_amoeboformis.AAC.1